MKNERRKKPDKKPKAEMKKKKKKQKERKNTKEGEQQQRQQKQQHNGSTKIAPDRGDLNFCVRCTQTQNVQIFNKDINQDRFV